MKDSNTTLYVVLFCMVLILGWMFAVYSPLRGQLQSVENLVKRRINRISVHTVVPEQLETSPKKLQQTLDTLLQDHVRLTAKVTTHAAHFVDLQSVDGLRKLRFEIANIAEASGLVVNRFGVMARDGEITDSVGALRNQIRKPYGRPVLSFEANGSFGQISAFVKKLGELKYSVAVLNLAIIAPEFKDMLADPKSAHLLHVKLEMAL